MRLVFWDFTSPELHSSSLFPMALSQVYSTHSMGFRTCADFSPLETSNATQIVVFYCVIKISPISSFLCESFTPDLTEIFSLPLSDHIFTLSLSLSLLTTHHWLYLTVALSVLLIIRTVAMPGLYVVKDVTVAASVTWQSTFIPPTFTRTNNIEHWILNILSLKRN